MSVIHGEAVVNGTLRRWLGFVWIVEGLTVLAVGVAFIKQRLLRKS